jgi:hypothetical protein
VVDADDKPLLGLTAETHVRLWHPLGAVFPLVAAWREWLERHRVRQPFKQAHREIYVLTDAERTTATYSNRFAAHIIRQHQFRALAQARSWSYQLGVMDSWVVPTLELPKHRLRVEFFVDDIDVMDRSPSGIPLYIATDQVRFLRPGLAEPRRRREPDVALPLDEIPALIFSEVMRDVDLFVGVASVGADPTWADHGPEAIRAYWSDFAFGELSESAKTRRAVLERLIPRLAIAPRCSLEERALVVRGDLRTYRIHLGSGNIQMEPNNEYLCIVPERGGKAEKSDLFLPFEGDGMLSTIISKAILLSNDRAITDPTIVRQITRAINAEQIRALANDATARTR